VYIDPDDFVHPEFLAATVDAIERQGVDCAYSDFQFVGLSNDVWRPEPSSADALAEAQWIPGPGTVMRRSVWEQVGGYGDFMPNQDWDFWIGAITAGVSVARVPRLLYFYRRHAESVGATTARTAWISREVIIKRRAEFFAVGDRAKKFRAGGLLSSAYANRVAGDRWQWVALTARAISVDPRLIYPETKAVVRDVARRIKRKTESMRRRPRQIPASPHNKEISLPPLDWDAQAPILHNQYGHLSHDFYVLGHVIDKTGARSVLEIGCGSGRLVPVYLAHNVETILLQDVSVRALDLCRQRFFCQEHIRYFHGNVQNVPISAAPDLVVASRVLQYILKNDEFKGIMNYLTSMARYFYINEAGVEEATSINWPYLKRRDYLQVFSHLGYKLVEQDELIADSGRQRWMLFEPQGGD
jgi:hypothetical protein